MIIKFYKESDNRWYADVPEWTGDKADLEMVSGADIMLDIFSQGSGVVTLDLTTEKVENPVCVLSLYELCSTTIGGGYYKLSKYLGVDYGLDVWLCDVTKFLFGNMPEFLYICTIVNGDESN